MLPNVEKLSVSRDSIEALSGTTSFLKLPLFCNIAELDLNLGMPIKLFNEYEELQTLLRNSPCLRVLRFQYNPEGHGDQWHYWERRTICNKNIVATSCKQHQCWINFRCYWFSFDLDDKRYRIKKVRGVGQAYLKVSQEVNVL
ncbi:hypothetical protein S83_068314 [Arachis hypogaea]|nr:uncharacterized protein LOC112779182 [Arachis hypogaea]